MSYATNDQLVDFIGEKQLAELTAESGSTPSTTVIDALLLRSSQFIDGYIGGRYALPVTDATALDVLEMHCLNIARWYAWERRAAGQYDRQAIDAFRASEDWLKRVGAGKADLPGASPRTSSSTVMTIGGSETQVFGTFNDYGGGNPL